MIKAEFIKPESDLKDVIFTSSKFGVFMLTCFGVGFGWGLMFPSHWILGLVTWGLSLLGLLWSFGTRGKY